MPAKVLPIGLREKMLDRCAARDTPFDHAAEWPDLPTGNEDPADAPPAAPADGADEAVDEDVPADEGEPRGGDAEMRCPEAHFAPSGRAHEFWVGASAWSSSPVGRSGHSAA